MKPRIIEGEYSTPDNPVKRLSPQTQLERKVRSWVNGLSVIALLAVDALVVSSRITKEPESWTYYAGIGLLAGAVVCVGGYLATRGEPE